MTKLTQRAIIDAFWQLLNEKSFSSLTVKDIVERCEMNRNTFYYHFRDLRDLLSRAVAEILEKGADAYPGDDFESLFFAWCARVTMSLARQKSALLNVYSKMPREEFENLVTDMADQIISIYEKKREIQLDDVLRHGASFLLVGMLLDWFKGGMKADLQRYSVLAYAARSKAETDGVQ